MRFYTVLASRPAYYDRNPATSGGSYAAGTIAPHAATTRVTYTVPTLRKAYIETLFLQNLRDGTSGAPSYVQARAQFTPNGGSQFFIAEAVFLNGAIDANRQVNMSSYGLMSAGDNLLLDTQDVSTGGTVFYVESIKRTEFDA